MRKLTSRQSGFTLIELLLATAFFSFILVFVSSGFLFVTRSFQKGRTTQQIHQNARRVMDQLSTSLRNSEWSSGSLGVNYRELCFSNGDNWHWTEPNPKSSGEAAAHTFSLEPECDGVKSGEDRLDEGVAVWNIDVHEIADGTYHIVVELVSEGETVVVDGSGEVSCAAKSGPDSAYCDVVRLETTVSKPL